MWAVAPAPADGKCPQMLRLGGGGDRQFFKNSYF